jgi:hypothetical protein
MISMNASFPPRAQHGTLGSGVILLFFGTVWWLVGAIALGQVAVLVAGLAAVVALSVLAVRRLDNIGGREAYERAAPAYRTANAAQAAGTAAVVAACVATGGQQWIPALVTVVVGAHFFPLVRPFGRPEYRWTGALLIALGLAGCVTALAGAEVTTVLTLSGLGSATILWGTTAWHVAGGAPDASAAPHERETAD